MTLDRYIRVPANAEDLSQFLKSATQTNTYLHESLELGNVKYLKAIDYLNDEEGCKVEPCESVFASGMPGAMSIEELETMVYLGEWLIQVGDQVVMLEV